jgi:large subunit ribosomal protein L25
MEEIILEVEPREELGKGKVKDVRRKGFIPGIIYAKGKEPQALKVPHRGFLRLVHEHRIENIIINLKVSSGARKSDEKGKARPCLIKEIQYDPLRGDIIHVDFNEISLHTTVKVSVPLVAVGEPIGVKQEGGSLEHILWEVEVECLPTDIPEEIKVDVSSMKIGDSVHIKEINFPANIKVLNDPDATALSVIAPMKEEVVAAPVEGEEQLEPEVIKEKKEEAAEGEEKEGKDVKETKEEKEKK